MIKTDGAIIFMFARSLSAALLAIVALPAALLAADPSTYTFQTHASFFSAETQQPRPLDPQIFVADSSVPAATGPQGIVHVAGFRPAFLTDQPSTVVHNANGKPLGFTLGTWLSANGTATITPSANGSQSVALAFAHLIPNGVYSVFENHFASSGVTFTPLDGSGTTNTFIARADGTGKSVILSPEPFTHANAILLVYHSDGQSHGTQRGSIGIDAHHQLIMRFP